MPFRSLPQDTLGEAAVTPAVLFQPLAPTPLPPPPSPYPPATYRIGVLYLLEVLLYPLLLILVLHADQLLVRMELEAHFTVGYKVETGEDVSAQLS